MPRSSVETFGDVIQDALAAPPKADMLPGAHGPEALLHEKLAALPPDHPFRVAFASLSSDVRVGQALQKLQDNITNSRGQADRDVSDTGSLRLLLQSATQFNSLPDSYYLHGVVLVSKKVVGSGAFGDVYRGKWGEKDVALKVLRVLDFQSGYATLLREIIIWRQLSHPNIQPFLGVDSQLFPSRLAVASKWEGNGSVKIAMRTFQAHVLDTLRPAWIIDTAQGLKYLHDNYIVHGDLRGDNILITEDRHARLTDFGLTSLADSTTRTMGTRSGKAPFAWAAPELSEDLKHPNFACDVYSFACTCVEIYSGDRPFAGLNDIQIVTELVRGNRPHAPTEGPKSRPMPVQLWNLVNRCWAQEPSERPTVNQVVLEILGTA